MTLLKHLAIILASYLLAAIVTGYVVDISLLFDHSFMGESAQNGLLLFGVSVSAFVFYFAAWPASFSVAVGEYFSIRSWWYYALSGATIGLGLGIMFNPPEFFPWLGLGFGPVSGLIFWAGAGRRAGLEDTRLRIGVACAFAAVAVLLLGFTWASWFGTRI
jgi:hypothetical protein